MPIFSKYDAKKNLFIENFEENNVLDNDKYESLKKKNQDAWTSFKILRTTNKGNLKEISFLFLINLIISIMMKVIAIIKI